MQTIFRTILPSSSPVKAFRVNSKCMADLGQWKEIRESPVVAVSSVIFARTKKTVAAPSPENAAKGTAAIFQKDKGRIYDKKPFKFTCIAGKSYLWCCCGWSKTQPFCDSTHKNPHYRITIKPIRFIAKETKEYTFCNCKQSNNRPFCDGTHVREDIQAAVKS